MLPKHLVSPDPEIYLSDNYLVLDFETDGLPTDPNFRIVLSGWKCSNGEYIAHFGDEYSLSQLHSELDRVDFVVAQNAKFELQCLERSGYDIGRLVVFDTMLAEYVILGNRSGSKSLQALGEKYGFGSKGGLVHALFKAGYPSSDIPSAWLQTYNERDVRLTEQVFRLQRDLLRGDDLLPVLFTRCLTTVPLASIERRGLFLDASRVDAKLREVETEYNLVLAKLEQIAGGINWSSTKQVREYLYEKLKFAEVVDYRGELSRTDTGLPRTDADAIQGLAARTSAQRTFKSTFLNYRKLDLSLRNLRKMQEACQKDGGIIYGTINQAVTRSHRTSSSGGKYKLQFQNFDRDFKGLFKARERDWNIGEADGKQLEFRVAVHLGSDEQGLTDVRSNFDVHSNTARILLKRPEGAISTAERYDAKSRTFKPLFGGQSGSPSERAYFKAFRERYNGVYETQRGWTYEVLLKGQLRVASGLIFYWPGTKQRRSGWIDNTTSIFNYPVQSLATAEIIPISMVYLWHLMRLHGMKSFLVNTVHDSVIAEIAPGESRLFADLCRLAFTEYVFDYLKVNYGIRFVCPLGVETKVGSHWSGGEVLKDDFDLDPQKYFH